MDSTTGLPQQQIHTRIYFANQYLYKTTNGGESWTQISQDMTREEPGAPANLNEAARCRCAAKHPTSSPAWRSLHDRTLAFARANDLDWFR
jgi:hypothetical protein